MLEPQGNRIVTLFQGTLSLGKLSLESGIVIPWGEEILKRAVILLQSTGELRCNNFARKHAPARAELLHLHQENLSLEQGCNCHAYSDFVVFLGSQFHPSCNVYTYDLDGVSKMV